MREAGFIVSHDAVKLYFKKYDPFNRVSSLPFTLFLKGKIIIITIIIIIILKIILNNNINNI